MGWLGGVTDQLGITSGGKRIAGNEYGQAFATAGSGLNSAYGKGQEQLQAGYDKAMNMARSGFSSARDTAKTGYDTSRGELKTGYDTAEKSAKEGYAKAQGYYDTPEVATSRQELFNRVLGNGGMSDATLEAQKAKAREEYGAGLRSTQDALTSQFGDSSSEGMAGENLARAAASLGAERANAVRGIDIGNEQLKRQEMTGAIGSLEAEAGARSGLSAQEAQLVSGLEARFADNASNLTAQETNALSQLAAGEGSTLADLQGRLATGQASLTTEEAKALAELMTTSATGKYTVASKGNLLSSIWGG
jgi:hypothetical protein